MTGGTCRRAVLGILGCLALSLPAPGSFADESYLLRGYRHLQHRVEQRETALGRVALHRFSFEEAERAVWFASKIYADFELTPGNAVRTLETLAGPVDVVDLAGAGLIAPLLERDAHECTILVSANADAVLRQLPALVRTPPLRRSELAHPLYLDKWDRYCLGVWQRIGDFAQDDLRSNPDEFYAWLGEIGLNPQINPGNVTCDLVSNDNQLTWQRRYFAEYGVKYQRVEWLLNRTDIYNRNPFLTKTINPHVAVRWNYYGEAREGTGVLRDAQDASFLVSLRRLLEDANQMAILDPNGEIGPFAESFWGVSGPQSQREFARFLREVRGLSLEEVSRRYWGRPDALRSWEQVTLADWRTFYGWTGEALDLAGEWRFMRDDRLEGYAQGWSAPGFNDEDWVRLYYPGDALVYSLVTRDRPLWMRRTVTVDPAAFPDRVYLSVAPLSRATVQVFLNGQPLGALDPRFHTAHTFGQFDITEAVAEQRTLTIVLRFAGHDAPNGPVFLTSEPLESFPTSDPLVNARRWDHMEFVDWAAAEAVASTLRGIRALEPDRPLKVHAYGGSPWGWKTVAEYGGYSHHTGAGSGWLYTEPKQFGASRNLQHSSEPGSPMGTLRDLKGLFGNLVYMGKNAHDYFISLQSITRDPEMRAWFEAKLPAIKLMGRANVLVSPIAVINGLLNTSYEGEFAQWESWRYGVNPVRGGELVPFLDEVRLREGNLGRFRVIIDPGTRCWDEEMTAALRAYVEEGGILLLNSLSGAHTFLEQGHGAGPGAELAGVRLDGAPPPGSSLTLTAADARFPGLDGTIPVHGRPGVFGSRLQPVEGAEVIGTWSDESAAFTGRALGRGVIYFFGGSTYPGELMRALSAAFGPPVYATAEGGADLVRTLRSNNGCEDLLMVRGLGRPATVRWTLDYTPGGLYDPVSGDPVPAEINGNTVTFTTTIPDWDFAWFAVRRPLPEASFAHWFSRQTEIWSGFTLDAEPPEAPLFRHLDLNHDWRLVQMDSVERAHELRALDDAQAGFEPVELVFWDTPGMNLRTGADVVGLYRRDFTLPAVWERESLFALAIRGQIHDCPLHGFRGPSSIYLNGALIWEGERLDQAYLDVTALIRPGENRLEIIHQGRGLMPSLMLVRSAVPDEVVDLAGSWRAVQGLQQEVEAELPGTVNAALVYRDVTLPAAAQGQEIWLRVDGPCTFAVINGRLRYWDMRGVTTYAEPSVFEIDITPDVRFDQPNRLVLGTGRVFQGWETGELSYRQVELAWYRPGKWSADGRGTREALTPTELDAVARDLSVIQTYPLVHAALEKSPPDLLSDLGDAPLSLPAAILDLDLSPVQGLVEDRGPHRVPVEIIGGVEPFAEAGGRISGVYLRGESPTPGTLKLPPRVFREHMENRSFTIRAWLKPLALNRAGGSLFNWTSWLLGWNVENDRSVFWLHAPPGRRMIAENVIRQRAWQSLTLVVDGRQATLYTNAVPVARQTWDLPAGGTDDAVYLGSVQALREFLNAKLAAFTIFEGVLSPAEVARLFVQERARYAPEPDAAWPEEDFFRLAVRADGPQDAAEIPAQIESGPGVSVGREGDRPHLSFSGQSSYLLFRDHPRARHFAEPFSLVWEMRMEPGATGMIFRRHHILCLELGGEGALVFDANIGRNYRVTFPGAVPAGRWVRLMLTYDRQTVRLFRDGELIAAHDYPGALIRSEYPVVFFADNTYPTFPDHANIRADLRELRIVPTVLPAMPEPLPPDL